MTTDMCEECGHISHGWDFCTVLKCPCRNSTSENHALKDCRWGEDHPGECKPRGTNPKDVHGLAKLPILSVVPASSILWEAAAFRDGQKKYGPYNWRKTKVSVSVFIDAAVRHLLAYFDGEDFARDSEVHHLSHAKACIGIIIDGLESGVLVDDRPPKGNAANILERLCLRQDGTPGKNTVGETPTAGSTGSGKGSQTC